MRLTCQPHAFVLVLCLKSTGVFLSKRSTSAIRNLVYSDITWPGRAGAFCTVCAVGQWGDLAATVSCRSCTSNKFEVLSTQTRRNRRRRKKKTKKKEETEADLFAFGARSFLTIKIHAFISQAMV